MTAPPADAPTAEPQTETTIPYSDHLLPADPSAWAITGAIACQSTRTTGRLGVSVPVFCLPPAGLPEAATAAAVAAQDVSAAVAADPRVVEAAAKRSRLAVALERDRAAVRDARTEADRHAADARTALAAGDDPDQSERLRDAATARAEKLGSRCGELSELLTAAGRESDAATEAATRDARLKVKAEYAERLRVVSARLSEALAADLAEVWLSQSVVNALAAVR